MWLLLGCHLVSVQTPWGSESPKVASLEVLVALYGADVYAGDPNSPNKLVTQAPKCTKYTYIYILLLESRALIGSPAYIPSLFRPVDLDVYVVYRTLLNVIMYGCSGIPLGVLGPIFLDLRSQKI